MICPRFGTGYGRQAFWTLMHQCVYVDVLSWHTKCTYTGYYLLAIIEMNSQVSLPPPIQHLLLGHHACVHYCHQLLSSKIDNVTRTCALLWCQVPAHFKHDFLHRRPCNMRTCTVVSRKYAPLSHISPHPIFNHNSCIGIFVS